VPVSAVTGRPGSYEVTATLGNETVSVWAQLAARGAFSVRANGPGVSYPGCGPGGSHYRVGHVPANAGAGTPPDCGVLWQGPVARATVQATLRWTVSWGAGVLSGPGTRPLPPIPVTGQSAPFPQRPWSPTGCHRSFSSAPRQFTVVTATHSHLRFARPLRVNTAHCSEGNLFNGDPTNPC